jgi:hypothetical protein
MVPALIWPTTLPSPHSPIGVEPERMALTASPPLLNACCAGTAAYSEVRAREAAKNVSD